MLLGRGQLQQVGAPTGGDDEIGFQAGTDGLDQHIDAQIGPAAAGRVAHDPAHGIAGGDRHQFLARLKRNHRHAPRRRIDLIKRAIGERPHLNRVDVALTGRRDTRFCIGTGNAHLFVGRLRRNGGLIEFRQRLQLRRQRQRFRDGDDFDGLGRFGQWLGQHRLVERDGRRRLALRGAAREGQQRQRKNVKAETKFHGLAPSEESSSRLHDRPLT